MMIVGRQVGTIPELVCYQPVRTYLPLSAAPTSLAAIRVDRGEIFVSLELSKSTRLITSLSPGSEKMSRYTVPVGDLPELLTCLEGLRDKPQVRESVRYPLIVIQEAGLDGFWIHRCACIRIRHHQPCG